MAAGYETKNLSKLDVALKVTRLLAPFAPFPYIDGGGQHNERSCGQRVSIEYKWAQRLPVLDEIASEHAEHADLDDARRRARGGGHLSECVPTKGYKRARPCAPWAEGTVRRARDGHGQWKERNTTLWAVRRHLELTRIDLK